MLGIKFLAEKGVGKGAQKAFQKHFMAVKSPEDAAKFLKRDMGVSSEMLTMASLVEPLPNTVTQHGLGLFTYYARVTGPNPEKPGEVVNGEIDLTKGMVELPDSIRLLVEEGLKIAAAVAMKKGTFTQITPDNALEYVRIGTEKFVEEHHRASAAEKKLAEATEEYNRQVSELMDANRHAVGMLQKQHRDELAKAREAFDACVKADDKKIQAAERRATFWKAATKGILARYRHWRVAAITAYNILEGRDQPDPIIPPIIPITAEAPPAETDSPVEADYIPESPPKPAIPATKPPKPIRTLLTPEERQRRAIEAGKRGAAARWANTTPEERRAVMADARAKRWTN